MNRTDETVPIQQTERSLVSKKKMGCLDCAEGIIEKAVRISMKTIAIVSLGYFWTPMEPGPTRFFQIAMTFSNAGYDVEVITTKFQHFNKRVRDTEVIKKEHYPFRISFIDVPPYKKNVGIGRIYSNKIAARHVHAYMSERILKYAAVYCSIPANDIAAKVAVLCHQNTIPCIIDIEDLWPEAMGMVIKNERIRKFMFGSFRRDAEIVYRNADGIIGTSEDYTARAFKNRSRDIPSDTVYVGCDLDQFDVGVRKYSHEIEKSEEEFWVTYAGSISTSYDIRTLILAAKELQVQGHWCVRFQILGTGSQKEEMEELVESEGIRNVIFWGYVPYQKMAAVLSKSDLVVNSFIRGAPQSITNKVGDYLAGGKAMVNTLENPVFCSMVQKYRVGINIQPEETVALSRAVLWLKENKEERIEMGKNARNLAEKEFDRKVSYRRIVKLVETCMISSDKC